MVQYQIKLRLNKVQEADLGRWLWQLTGVWNWAIRKIELDAKDGIYYAKPKFMNLLAGHSRKMEVPSHISQQILANAWESWSRCFKRLSMKPRLKGNRNKLCSFLAEVQRHPAGGRTQLLGLGKVRYHKQSLPEGKIKTARIIKRVSGWYLSLCIEAEPRNIPIVGNSEVGIDPGFSSLLTLSNGEKIEHPREFEAKEKRIGQAQRGRSRELVRRLHEKVCNQRKDRNHKISRRIVSENELIAFSADSHSRVARRFGKSVTSSSHRQLRHMLSYKCTTSGRTYVEVDPRNSTRVCSECRALTGPTGLTGLSVRRWQCAECGALHDRDVNAARNALLSAGAGAVLEESESSVRNLHENGGAHNKGADASPLETLI